MVANSVRMSFLCAILTDRLPEESHHPSIRKVTITVNSVLDNDSLSMYCNAHLLCLLAISD